MEKIPAVYMMANRKNGVIYIGVTSNLPRRVDVHKSQELDGFSKRYNTDKLVWYRLFNTMEEAIIAEKRLKSWKRAWKIREIEKVNPEWKDLAAEEGQDYYALALPTPHFHPLCRSGDFQCPVKRGRPAGASVPNVRDGRAAISFPLCRP